MKYTKDEAEKILIKEGIIGSDGKIAEKYKEVLKYTCPKCGSHNIESNRDINNAFIRCKDCGHYLREGKR